MADENISAFAAYNSMNGTVNASRTTNGKGKNKKATKPKGTPKFKIMKPTNTSITKKKNAKSKKKNVRIAEHLNKTIGNTTKNSSQSNRESDVSMPSTPNITLNSTVNQTVYASTSTTATTAKRKRATKSTKTKKIAASTSDVEKVPEPNTQNESLSNGSIQNNHVAVDHNATNASFTVSSQNKINDEGSILLGKKLFAWLLNPLDVDEFMNKHWEKSPLYIKRDSQNVYKNLLSTEMFDEMLRRKLVEFTKNLDVTSYKNGVRETHNSEGRALPSSVWQFYNEGCSIRMLNPQTFLPTIHELNATLQEYFHCMTGANIYLTPPNSQGFAPHYDDIEAFVLQIEGKKKWKLYKPRSDEEYLARDSSANLNASEIGQPVLEKTLEAGDLLYFPRGTIHQAQTIPGCHSLHITLSFYQKTSYGDLLELLLPQALQTALSADVEFRRGLPLNIWHNMGLVHEDSKSTQRHHIKTALKKLFTKLVDYADMDGSVDQMALKYQHDALPPFLSGHEKVRTIFGTKSIIAPNGKIREKMINLDTRIRLLRANIVRLVPSEDTYRLYYYVENSKEYHEYDLNYMELDEEAAPTIECFIKAYPQYVKPSELEGTSPARNLEIAQLLWGRGLLMTANPID